MNQRGFVVGDRVIGLAADSHPDWIAGFGELGSYCFVGASAIGKIHIRDVRPRDDSFAIRSCGDWLAVAVADGVGSRKQSRYGSSLAADALCEYLLRETENIQILTRTPTAPTANKGRDALGNERTSEAGALPIPGRQEPSAAETKLSTSDEERLARIEEKLRNLDNKESSSLFNWFSHTLRNPLKQVRKHESAEDSPAYRDKDCIQSEVDAPVSRRNEMSVPSETNHPPSVTAPAPTPARASANTNLPLELSATSCGTLTWHWQTLKNAARDNKSSDDAGEATLSLDECVRRAFRGTRQTLEQFAAARGVDLRELHCTLMCILINTRTGEVASGHIGDGLVAYLEPDQGAGTLVDAPTPGEVGEVYIITQSNWEKYLAVRSLTAEQSQGISTFYLMTDGVSDDYTSPPPLDIFDRWTKDINREMRKDEPLSQRATKLLHWLNTYEVSGSYDDRTLVVVMRGL